MVCFIWSDPERKVPSGYLQHFRQPCTPGYSRRNLSSPPELGTHPPRRHNRFLLDKVWRHDRLNAAAAAARKNLVEFFERLSRQSIGPSDQARPFALPAHRYP